MSKAKKILITTESSEIFILRRSGQNTIRGFCSDCAAEIEMLTLDEAVSFSALNTRELICRIETGAVHSIETLGGHLLVCQKSLQATGK